MAAPGLAISALLPAGLALAVFAIAYGLIASDRLNRSVIALLAASVLVLAGVITQDEAIRGIDFNTIALLTGMMVLVSISRRSGLFEYLALWTAKRGRAEPWAMLAMLSLATAFISAFLDNVTTVLLIAPVTLAVTRRLGVPPQPFLFAEVFAANIGGTATLIGDPPNIIIGSAADLSFNDFILNVTPVIAAIMAVQVLVTHLLWGRRLAATQAARAQVMAVEPRSMVIDPTLLRQALAVFAAVIAGFVFARPLKLEAGTIALAGAALLMLCHTIAHHREKDRQTRKLAETFGEVDWVTIFFFIGLFVIVHAVDRTGVLALGAQKLMAATGGDRAATAAALLWGSAVLSAIVDNVPFVAAMIPLIRQTAPHWGSAAAMAPLWWALSLGACLGGNATLIGASANLAMAGIAERNQVPFGFVAYMKYALGLTVLSLVLCQAYLWLRYF